MVYFAKWKIILIAFVCLFGLAYAAPNFVPQKTLDELPSWLPNKQMSLGLDLRGGSYLLIEVDVAAVIRDRQQGMVDGIRAALRPLRVGYRRLGIDGEQVGFTLRNPSDSERVRPVIRRFARDSSAELTIDGSRLNLAFTEEAIRDIRSSAVQQSIEIVRRRIDETGVREPTIQRQGADRIIVQLPGVDDPQRIKAIIGKTAKMTFHLLDGSVTQQAAQAGRAPPGVVLLPSQEEVGADGEPIKYPVRKRVMVSGENLVDAQPTVQDGLPVVSFRFDAVGARRFGDTTRRNVGRPFAIVLDGEVISAPVIREPILGGAGVISGSFTTETAGDLALLLRAGALPAPLTFLEERTVGAEMGADAVRAGEIASVLAIVAVIVFMGLAYGRFGLMADVALIMNILLIAALLSLLQATLTLPGIAGIVLTIGMAVDANVLVFERIREEQRNGRTPISAVDAGYGRALTTIIDANLTTLIAAILLYQFGSGPVRGFAVTLAFGLLTSMFTAIMLTRLLVVNWLRRKKPQRLPL